MAYFSVLIKYIFKFFKRYAVVLIDQQGYALRTLKSSSLGALSVNLF